MKIATFNINNVVRRLPNLLEWLRAAAPDVVCLQELKTTDASFPEAAMRDAGYHAVWRGQSTWNGVAILARKRQPILIRDELPGDPADTQSRYIEAAVDGVLDRLHLPAERQSAARPEIRLQARLVRPADRPCGRAARRGRARRPRRRLQRRPDRSGHLPDQVVGERCAAAAGEPGGLSSGLLAIGWTDAVRTLHPADPMYTFWDYKRDRWRRDAGLRIDHLLLSPPLASRLAQAGVDRDVRGEAGASDHAPAWIVLR